MEDLGPSERTKARSALYHILSSAFYPPSSDASDVWAKLNVVASSEDEESKEILQLDRNILEQEYNRLFVGPGRLPCPPYESVHRKDRPEMDLGLVLGPSVLDVKRRYAEAGLAISKNFRDLPDHIAVELEFMYFLCSKELESRTSADGEKWRRMQQEFVALHLKPWVGAFSAKASGSTTSPFYKLAATVLEEFISDEIDYLGVA